MTRGEDLVRHERFTVPADEQLRAAARGDLTRLGQISIELESQLRPREIQARIRAGQRREKFAHSAIFSSTGFANAQSPNHRPGLYSIVQPGFRSRNFKGTD